MLSTRRSVKPLISGAMIAAYCFLSIPLQAQAPAPAKSPSARQQQLRTAVDEAYAKFKSDTKGKNADYIPYLAKVDSNLFGISVVIPIAPRSAKPLPSPTLAPTPPFVWRTA